MRCPQCPSESPPRPLGRGIDGLPASAAGVSVPVVLPSGFDPGAVPKRALPLPGFARARAWRCPDCGARFALIERPAEPEPDSPPTCDPDPTAPPYTRLHCALPYARLFAATRPGWGAERQPCGIYPAAGGAPRLAYAEAISPQCWIFRFEPPANRAGQDPALTLLVESAAPLRIAAAAEDASFAAGSAEANTPLRDDGGENRNFHRDDDD